MEAVPAHPEDKCAERCQGDIGARHRIDPAIFAILAFAGAKDDGTSQGRPTTDRVNDRGTGVIRKTHFTEPAATPAPGALNRVDHTTENDAEGQEGPELDPLGNTTGHDRAGGATEDHLEEPVGCSRITGRVVPAESCCVIGNPEAQ